MKTCNSIFLPLLFLGFGLLSTAEHAKINAHDNEEKKRLEHTDYEKWNSIGSQSISNDGKWISYSIRPGKGDATLKIREVASAKEYSVVRGSGLRFTIDSKFAIYTISPDPEVIKKLKKEKKKPEEYPKTKLEILDLAKSKITTIDGVSSFTIPEKAAGWLAYKTAEGVAAKKESGKSSVTEEYMVTPKGLEKSKPSAKKSVAGKSVAGKSVAGKSVAGKSVAGKSVAGKSVAGKTVAGKPAATKPSEKTTETKSQPKKVSGKKAASAKTKPEQKESSQKEPVTRKTKSKSETRKNKRKNNKKEKSKETNAEKKSKNRKAGKQKSNPKKSSPKKSSPKKLSKSKNSKSETSTTKQETKKEVTKTAKTSDKKAAPKKTKKNGTTLVLRNLENQLEFRFANVVNFRFSKHAELLAMTTSGERPEDDGVHSFDLKSHQLSNVISGQGNYGQPVINEDATMIAFLTDKDDYVHKMPSWSLYLWDSKESTATSIVTHETKGMPKDWWIKSSVSPSFAEDSRRLTLDTAPIPEDRNKADEKKSDAEPKAKLDIWHWQDSSLQPMQLLRINQDKNRSYTAIYDLTKKTFIQLENKEMNRVSIDLRSSSDVAIGIASEQYDKIRSWDISGYNDSYLVNLNTGKATPIMKMAPATPSLSPNGKFITWWDGKQKKWFAHSSSLKPNQKMKPVDLGKGIKFRLDNELHDTPSLPRSYGAAGWLDNDAAILLYDRWDIWRVDPAGKQKTVCITKGEGRKNLIQFRGVRLDSEKRTINLDEDNVLSAMEHKTKASGYYKLSPKAGLQKLLVLDEKVSGLRKAKDSDAVMFTRSTFQKSPDIWASTLGFKSIRRISKANPQQHEYLWGSAELVNWKANDGQPLDGILYKPENFDAKKKYPMIVYFYERNSDNLHSYFAPAAGRSIINFSFYVSRGYVVFIPDIPYKTGEPGPSAVNAILPGVESIVAKGFIDKKKIGMQGHSWGGYQTAYLVTQTDMFACAESGAPVSNMTSAYGGIRWGTGMSRMFQYEQTQSRIGGTLWEARDKYIANSPVFFADKINTPLLILHNDKDTAVPWYQGIELFVAMRRLNKPSWMLNYNGDPHWVMSDENRMDFAKRMQQFFDHYLMDEPVPVWMAKGIPAVDKGEEFGFEPAEKPNGSRKMTK